MKLTLATLTLALAVFTVAASDKLPITIYYEALCPDSRKLIAELDEVYPNFKDDIAVKYVPFGRAKSLDDNGEKFECHHGPAECAGNRIQSCGLSKLEGNPDAQEAFVVCQMTQPNDTTGKECAEKVKLDWEVLNKCIEGDAGRKLQLVAEAETHFVGKPAPKNVPTVVFNNKFDEKLQEKAVKGLKTTLCELLSDTKLSACA